MKKILFILLVVLVSIFLFGCDSYYTTNEFCNKKGYEYGVFKTASFTDSSFFCFNEYTENDKIQVNASRIYSYNERLKKDCCCD